MDSDLWHRENTKQDRLKHYYGTSIYNRVETESAWLLWSSLLKKVFNCLLDSTKMNFADFYMYLILLQEQGLVIQIQYYRTKSLHIIHFGFCKKKKKIKVHRLQIICKNNIFFPTKSSGSIFQLQHTAMGHKIIPLPLVGPCLKLVILISCVCTTQLQLPSA